MAKYYSWGLAPARSLDELVEFFDTHDMDEHWEHMPEAHFDIDIKKRTHFVAIDEELLGKLAAIAQSQHVSAEMLIHTWLKEKMLEVGS